MKKTRAVLTLILGMSNLGISSWAFADARIFSGMDDQGKPCSMKIIQTQPDQMTWTVMTSYASKTAFVLNSSDGQSFFGARAFVNASSRIEMSVTYVPAQQRFVFGEVSSNARTGEIVFERIRECRLDQ